MKEAVITIRLTEDIKNQLKEKAKQYGMATSEYVRFLISKDLEKK